MNENVKPMCICELGYDKGVLKKTIENNVFTIYGNVIKSNYIILRYHGELIDNVNYENYTNNLCITYYFDNNEENKETVCLAKCTKCVGENYCVLIYLEEHSKISFNFKKCDDDNNAPNYEYMNFELKIQNDPLAEIIEKIEKEDASNLPIAPREYEFKFKDIINKITAFFASIFIKKSAA